MPLFGARPSAPPSTRVQQACWWALIQKSISRRLLIRSLPKPCQFRSKGWEPGESTSTRLARTGFGRNRRLIYLIPRVISRRCCEYQTKPHLNAPFPKYRNENWLTCNRHGIRIHLGWRSRNQIRDFSESRELVETARRAV